MAYSVVFAAAINGNKAELVEVETDISSGLPIFQIVGYLAAEVKESTQRVRTAIKALGLRLPPRRILVNISPATIRKRGPAFDLPIVATVLCALGELPEALLENVLIIGEIGLDGSVKGVTGVLAMLIEAKKRGLARCVIPRDNYEEARLLTDLKVVVIDHIEELKTVLSEEPEVSQKLRLPRKRPSTVTDFRDISGQEMAKRALEIAVSGGHNLLMIGPPGGGKTLLAKSIPSILPALSEEEILELTSIYSIAGSLSKDRPHIYERPFRSVNHTATSTAILGGGTFPRAGEATLAHRGVLFLDELTEFRKGVLECLREPLEEKQILLIRQQNTYLFPADFLLVGACNPCPCGNYPDRNLCQCTEVEISHYLRRLSDPFLDRMDISIQVPKVPIEELQKKERGKPSATYRKRVLACLRRQEKRYQSEGLIRNGNLQIRQIKKYCGLSPAGEALMAQAYDRLDLTVRSYHKVLKVARTIADLDGCEKIEEAHLLEALGYRLNLKQADEGVRV
ncbi:magnesium chelatase family protein [Lachnospiraceae bacterium PM6-15]|uniref:YifB family Mg chelatase-like AAA ATPase n=1 Tax=Ohessyouella blattaphilus TaxID=2949333 RepID=A0ABT1EHD8_9FIRM|nr:YifB family Mg chelatase-like AAA ATPase [Ohessyouella blattaphilus]MCP1109941.1 YifB family Mg chelatase-like AAA ATPase [Ohessyouella blattaphilus]MCR8563335.1 YifB family Mg chelatase-like AAA ATPase [Ohessyouella blattaphilus]